MTRPNIVFVFGDQWRAQAVGYAGNPQVHTPNIDRLATLSVNFSNAVAGCPVCSPYRASLLTGQQPLTHGVFVNDVCLDQEGPSIAQALAGNGYDTAYIGKWHVDGHGRTNYIPPERRQGFDYWKVLECTHNYNHSAYYAGDSPEKLFWEGYDAIAQTRDACRWLRDRSGENPFLLMLSWGPPHNPYDTAPEEFKALYDADRISLRANVPEDRAENARRSIAGYYAHCSALDRCVGQLLQTLDETGLADNTIFVFTSDHGDLLGSHGAWDKQQPWDEAVRVPFLLRFPRLLGDKPRTLDAPIDAPDIMPTLLGLAGVPIPPSVEGLDYSAHIQGGADPSDGAAVLQCPHPFGNWNRVQHAGREYRGLRTSRYTYVRTLDGPWLLFDNETDPCQLDNLVDRPEHRPLLRELDAWLQRRLDERGDEFLHGDDYIRRWGYKTDERGTVPFTWDG
jgi:arylsulfatase A-like enzyme